MSKSWMIGSIASKAVMVVLSIIVLCMGAAMIPADAHAAEGTQVAAAPGAVEAATRQPFSGPSGRRLFAWLVQAGWDEATFRREAYITAMTRCYPGKSRSGRGDRVPGARERALCAPYLEREMLLLQPKVVIAVGRAAIAYFLGKKSLSECIGGTFPAGGAIIVPLPHPSGANLWLNAPENVERLACALSLLASLRRQHGL